MPEGRILVVDDELSMREVLEITLRQEGYDVTLADGGEAALRALDAAAFDLVVTDLRMRGVDGLAVLRAVKERAPGTAVLMLTAFALCAKTGLCLAKNILWWRWLIMF